MTPEQKSAFEVGAGYPPDQVALLISGVGAALVLLFSAWVIYTAYQGWADKSLSSKQLGMAVLRCTLLIFVLLVIFAI